MRDIERYVELYTDYLIASGNNVVTATGLSRALDGEIAHDRFTRMLREGAFDAQYLWQKVKRVVRQIESEDGCLIIDDTIIPKPHSDENEIVCWHYEHSQGRNVKGINLVNLLYYSKGIAIPVDFEVVRKGKVYINAEGKRRRKADKTKNELVREMLQRALTNRIPFRFVLMDSWFAAKENFEFITKKRKHFIAALKSNRLFATSLEDKHQGKFIRVGDIELQDKKAVRGYLKGYDKEVLLIRCIFTNKDGRTAMLHLVCSDTSLPSQKVVAIYQKRWKVEEYHKSLKSNAALAKSPTKKVVTQISHLVMSMVAVLKLECLKIKHNLNHFALRAKILIKANMAALAELQRLRKTTGFA